MLTMSIRSLSKFFLNHSSSCTSPVMGACSSLSTVMSSNGACSSNSPVADIRLAVSGGFLLGLPGVVLFSVAVLSLSTSCTAGGGRSDGGEGDMCRDSGADV